MYTVFFPVHFTRRYRRKPAVPFVRFPSEVDALAASGRLFTVDFRLKSPEHVARAWFRRSGSGRAGSFSLRGIVCCRTRGDAAASRDRDSRGDTRGAIYEWQNTTPGTLAALKYSDAKYQIA